MIQDVDIPIDRAPEFLQFFQREIGIRPVWVCPFRAYDQAAEWTLFPTRPSVLYVNFGFWDVVRRDEAQPAGHFNRLVEREVERLGGIKSLYSESFYSPGGIRCGLRQGEAYRRLKSRYDPGGTYSPTLYEKCVLRH